MSQKYHVMHGRDHAAGGADPIPGGTGGIQFDTYPQDGGYLYAETTDGTASPNGTAIELLDTALLADDAGIRVQTSHGALNLVGSYATNLLSTGADILLSPTGIQMDADAFTLTIDAQTSYIMERVGTSLHRFKISTGGAFEVVDQDGQALFRVDGDGDLHGLSGKALTFDL